MLIELALGSGILALGGIAVFTLLPSTPSRAALARAEAARREAMRRRFDGAADMLHRQGFKTERMMISEDGRLAFFTEEASGRVCILEPGEGGRLEACYRNLRRLTGADLVELVSIAPDPGLLGRMRGDPPAGTRRITGAELRLSFDPEFDLPGGTVVLRFAPADIARARIAASSLRGESNSLVIADAKADARAKALEEAESRRQKEEEAKERRRREEAELRLGPKFGNAMPLGARRVI